MYSVPFAKYGSIYRLIQNAYILITRQTGMTAKADEPRTLIKVPVSFRTVMRQRAKTNDTTMIAEIMKLIENKARGTPTKQNTRTANLSKGDQISGIETEKATPARCGT